MEQEDVVLDGCELRCCSMADKIRYRWTFWLRTCVWCVRSREIVCLKSGRRFDQRFYYRARSSAYVSILHTLELKHVYKYFWNILKTYPNVSRLTLTRTKVVPPLVQNLFLRLSYSKATSLCVSTAHKRVSRSLGLTHDGDETTGNACKEEGSRGSVMAPMVAATFHHFYWSACSKKEFHRRVRWGFSFYSSVYLLELHTPKIGICRRWSCLSNKPKNDGFRQLRTTVHETFTMDEQCRMEFGEGYVPCCHSRTFKVLLFYFY